MDESECDEDVFGEYMASQLKQTPVDLEALNEIVENKIQLM